MQIQRHTSTFQGLKHTQDSMSQPQGQGPKNTEKWHHLLLQMSIHQLL